MADLNCRVHGMLLMLLQTIVYWEQLGEKAVFIARMDVRYSAMGGVLTVAIYRSKRLLL